uniref:Uncharacterized protein n=1 Tax=Fagus sylvatica TaxID=28930 RepID=A0A2N9F6P4_FAGSY
MTASKWTKLPSPASQPLSLPCRALTSLVPRCALTPLP